MYGLECFILIIIGIVMIARPQLFYELTERWKHDGGAEPSKFWIFNTRIGGAAFLLAGIVCTIFAFIPQT